VQRTAYRNGTFGVPPLYQKSRTQIVGGATQRTGADYHMEEKTMTDYKTRKQISAWTDMYNVGSLVNAQRLADLAVLREWVQAFTKELNGHYVVETDDLLDLFTSCETKLK
jgi:hypothetical protein